MSGPKIARYTWEELTGLEDLKDSDAEHLRYCFLMCRGYYHQSMDPDWLFETVLEPYFKSPERKEIYDLLYRFSDFYEVDQRKRLTAHRDQNGTECDLETWRCTYVDSFCGVKREMAIPIVSGERPFLG